MFLAGCQEEEGDVSSAAGGTETATAEPAEGAGSEAGEATVMSGEAQSSSDELETQSSDIGTASNEATDAAVDAARSGNSPAEAARDDAVEAAADEGTTGMVADGREALDELLAPEAWDSARVIAAIRASDLPEDRQAELVETVQNAEGEPGQSVPPEVVTEIREALIAGPAPQP